VIHPKDLWDQQGTQPKDHKDLKVMPIQDQQVLRVTKDLKDLWVLKDQQLRKVLRESKVIPHRRDLQETKVHKVTKVLKEILVTKVRVDRLVSKVPKETRHKDLRVRKETHLRV
jgi:hypothetical protein